MEPAGIEVPIVWRGRRALAFVPAPLADRHLELSAATVRRTATATADIDHAASLLTADHEVLARLLLRAEGLASSFVEGVRAPVVDVALAEQDGDAHDAAGWVAANLEALRLALASAHGTGRLSVEMLCEWHRLLMSGSPTPQRYVGRVRQEQGWIGGTSPLDAHLVTPPPAYLAGLLDDLVAYANRDEPDALAQAAIAHAQFEVIHPFGDGNGRIGRVLVSWLLARRLSLLVPPPVSVRIASDVGGYSSGLTLFRLGRHEPWIRWFAECVSGACRAQSDLVAGADALSDRWRAELGAGRSLRALRSDAAAWAVLGLLPRHVVLTSEIVTLELGVTNKGANDALAELVAAGVIVEAAPRASGRAGRPAKRYVSPDLLGLVGATPLR